MKDLLSKLLPFAELTNENSKEKLVVNTDHFSRAEYFRIGETDGYVQIQPFGYVKVNEQVLK